jgi:hypothetical protein
VRSLHGQRLAWHHDSLEGMVAAGLGTRLEGSVAPADLDTQGRVLVQGIACNALSVPKERWS